MIVTMKAWEHLLGKCEGDAAVEAVNEDAKMQAATSVISEFPSSTREEPRQKYSGPQGESALCPGT